MILNAITFGACVIMMILFRRLDRTNVKMAKLRRYSSRIFNDFKKLTEKESRKFQDATIEMDILIKKSAALVKNMSESMVEIETRLKGLDIERTNLKKVDDDLKTISSAARDVNKQIQFIASAKENFGDMTKKISMVSESIANMKADIPGLTHIFEEKLRERSREISEEFYMHAENLKTDLERKENELSAGSRERIFQLSEDFSKSVVEIESKMAESGEMLHNNFRLKIAPLIKTVEKAEDLDLRISKLQDTFSLMENNFFDEFQKKSKDLKSSIDSDTDKLTQKLKNVEINVEESRSKLIQSFEREVEKVRTELDNLSIHAVSKKDEIVQAARKEAESIRKRIEEFEDRFIVLENRIVDTAEEKLDSIDSEYQSIELRLNTLMGRIKDEELQVSRKTEEQADLLQRNFADLEKRIEDIRTEVIRYEQSNEIFGKTDNMVKKVDDSLVRLNSILLDAQDQSRELEKFVSDIDQIKDLKKSADREIRAYMVKKEKLGDMESEIKGLMEANDLVLYKSEKLLDSLSKIDAVNSRIEALGETYSLVERRIEELREYDDVIGKNLDSVNRSDIIIQSIDSRIKAFEKVVEKSDRRVEKLNGSIKKIEEETLILKTRESEIREVRDKLNEIDGLSDHMEERIKQIYAMFQKVDTIRKEIDLTDGRLQQMYQETDLKMKEFSDFIQAVDNNNPILKQVRSDIKGLPGKNLNDTVVKTVRELSNKGWNPESISKKLMIDENSVRFIINTTAL
ncbi:MAG: hypothetical protein WDA74_11350 [Spirochaetota bacterium]